MSKSSVSCCASSDWSYDRLVRDPLKAMFIGLRAQFRAETRTLSSRGRILGLPSHSRNIAASPRFRCTRLSSGAGPRMGGTPWRERAAWIAAGGQP